MFISLLNGINQHNHQATDMKKNYKIEIILNTSYGEYYYMKVYTKDHLTYSWIPIKKEYALELSNEQNIPVRTLPEKAAATIS